jgi:hypothetical protein
MTLFAGDNGTMVSGCPVGVCSGWHLVIAHVRIV